MSAPLVPLQAAAHLQVVWERLLQAAKEFDKAQKECDGTAIAPYVGELGHSLVDVSARVDRLACLGIKGLGERRREPR